ncbi:helix-turn-helix domain-containing protein, partial [Chamaesiphon polymorphus]
MSSKKITDADKLEIVDLYRQSGETTASLASRYGVSNSTISRLLKTSIPEAEYEILIQQKRGSKASGEEESPTSDEPTDGASMLQPTPTIESQPEPEELIAPEINSAEPTLRERAEPVITSLQTDKPDLAPPAIPSEPEPDLDVTPAIPNEPEPDLDATPVSTSAEDRAANQRRVRRRPSAPVTIASE